MAAGQRPRVARPRLAAYRRTRRRQHAAGRDATPATDAARRIVSDSSQALTARSTTASSRSQKGARTPAQGPFIIPTALILARSMPPPARSWPRRASPSNAVQPWGRTGADPPPLRGRRLGVGDEGEVFTARPATGPSRPTRGRTRARQTAARRENTGSMQGLRR